jgi:hypothetical protein
MRRRRHYATTGNRALLDVVATLATPADLYASDPATGDGPVGRGRQLIMGDIARVTNDTVDLAVDIVASAPIERVDLYDGLDHLETIRPYGEKDLGARVRLVYTGAEYRGRARTTTWDGGLTLNGADILRSGVVNNWNLDRGIQSQEARSVVWKAVTTGNYGAIDLWLSSLAGSLSFETKPVSGRIDLATLGTEPQIFDAGGLERRIEIQRLPETMSERRLRLRRTLNIRPSGDTRLYVRVQQEDGHRMWSSPIYLMR